MKPKQERPRTVEYAGIEWPASLHPVDVVKECIRRGGRWKHESGEMVGLPLFDLYKRMQELLWPDDEDSDWSDLILRTILEQRITVVQGSKDSSKTHTMAKYALTDYFCFPDETLILMSSTTLQGLELRVWGDLKDLFQRAKAVWPNIPGSAVDHKHGIFTDKLEDDGDVRNLRKGIICIACLDSNGQWSGMQQYVGIKQKRRRLLGDEVSLMKSPYLMILSNLDKGDFKGVFVGNPIGEGDPLDKLAEPRGGWDSIAEPTVTTTWENNWEGMTVQLVGTDSPAIRFPGKFKYLINQQDIDRIIQRWQKNSVEYWNQAMGVRKTGLNAHKVFTRDMALQFGSQEPPVWKGGTRTKGWALDAAYGGDRCPFMKWEFGEDINGQQILCLHEPICIPIILYPKTTPQEERLIPEDQIATAVKRMCVTDEIPPENGFFDSTGRGSLGTSFARIWSASVNPIEFGGSPTDRPVCNDLFLLDPKTGQRRLKRADEHYSKKVTELWFSLRYAGESKQLRSLPNSVLDELSRREWYMVRGDKYELESKEDYKERYGISPDYGDVAVIAVEGARRRGFQISRLEIKQTEGTNAWWREEVRRKADKLRASYTLNYQA